MLMEKERQEIVDYGKKMSSAGLSKGTSGNISAYDPVCGYMAISPSGLDYFETAAEDIVILDLDGNLIAGSHPVNMRCMRLFISFIRMREVWCMHTQPTVQPLHV